MTVFLFHVPCSLLELCCIYKPHFRGIKLKLTREPPPFGLILIVQRVYQEKLINNPTKMWSHGTTTISIITIYPSGSYILRIANSHVIGHWTHFEGRNSCLLLKPSQVSMIGEDTDLSENLQLPFSNTSFQLNSQYLHLYLQINLGLITHQRNFLFSI